MTLPAASNDWEEIQSVMYAPADAALALVRFTINNKKAQLVYVDNVEVTEVVQETQPTTSTTPSEQPTDPSEPTSPVNHVPNGDFENGTEGWIVNPNPGATVEVVTEGAYSGNSILCTANHTATEKAGITITKKNIAVGDFEAIKLSVMSKLLSGDDDAAYIKLLFNDAASTSKIIFIAGTEDWNEDFFTMAVPEGATLATVSFGNFTNSTVTYMVDNIKLEEYTGPIVPDDPTEPSEPEGSGITVLNGSFENDLTGWTAAAKPGATTTIVTDGAYSGKAALFTANASDAGNAANSISQAIRFSDIKAFNLSVMSKRLTGKNTGYVGLWFYWTVMWADSVYGTHPNYSDGSVSAYMKKPLAILSKLTNNPIIDGFLITAGGTGNVFENIVYLNPDPKPEYLSEHVGIVETLGYGVLRTGFADDDMMLTLKANDSQMGHNHYDQNSIQLNVGGNWLMKDPGAGSYYSSSRVFWTHTGHTTIMVDDNPQMIKGTASLKKVFSNNLYGYLIGSAPEAYGSDYDSQILTKFDRHAIQVNHEDKGYYVIIDDLASTKDHVYTWHMYNGARGTFSVDGKEVPALGTAQGNSVSVALGGDMLNLKFVDGDKLTVEDYAHTSGGSNVGYTVAVSSAASKAHQFMTLISTDSNPNVNFVDFVKILNNRRFTLPEYFTEGDINWDSSMPLGQDCVKEVNIDGIPAVFFRGNKVGDWITFPVTIEETGTYDVSLVMGIMGSSCQVKASVDDIATKVMDCSGMPQTTKELSFGELELTAGVHTVKLEVYGPGLDEDYEAGYYLIDVAGMNTERVGVETPPAEDLYVSETYDNEEVLGALVNYTENKYDFLLWSRTEGAVTAGALNTDAQQASILGLVDGKITEGFAATKATTMTYDGKVLFLAEKDVDIVASDTGWQVISAEAQTVQLTAVESEYDYVVTVNGEAADTKIVNGILEVAVAEGETAIAIVVNEPEPETSEPTEPSEQPTEPEKNEDLEDSNAALWIVIGVTAVLLAGIAVGIVLFVKKRKVTNVAADEAAE